MARASSQLFRDSDVRIQTPPRALRKLHDALDATEVSGDRTEVRILRRLQFAMALGSMPLISGLGLLYGAGGHWSAAMWCFGYVGLTLALVVALLLTGRFEILRVPHTLVVGALPVCLHVWLGGFTNSGGAILWTLIVPIAAAMFGFKRAWLWSLGVTIALAIGFFAYRPEAALMSGRELEFHFAFNAIGFSGFLFASVRHFVQRIDQEKARSERLLHQVLPAPIVRRLKKGQVIADHIPGVTVVFADLVGFTPLSAKLPPAQVVALLDEIFTSFDQLARQFGVEKIKTIGDAYMAVAGAPERCDDHAARAARLALAMRDYVKQLAAERDTAVAMRIGMHSGEVVAGVIGVERFAYDLWGDTVNTASRMESHGEPHAVQITAATKDLLATGFAIRERGPIEVKGRGTIVTYWLDGAA
jgi:guanylate cyclase